MSQQQAAVQGQVYGEGPHPCAGGSASTAEPGVESSTQLRGLGRLGAGLPDGWSMKVIRDRMRRHLAVRTLAAFIIAAIAVLAMDWFLGSGISAAESPKWVWPTGSPARVLERFNPPAKRWLAGHRGVDLSAGYGASIRSAGAGTVTFVGTIAGRGVVTVTHGELRTTYEPIDSAVAVGQYVAAGKLIGSIGGGGHCDSHCLHWGLLRGGTYLDPLLLLSHDPPVLKPLPGTASGNQSRQAMSSQNLTAESPTQSTHTRIDHSASTRSGATKVGLATGTALTALGLGIGGTTVARRKRKRLR